MTVTREVQQCCLTSAQMILCWSGHDPESIATRILWLTKTSSRWIISFLMENRIFIDDFTWGHALAHLNSAHTFTSHFTPFLSSHIHVTPPPGPSFVRFLKKLLTKKFCVLLLSLPICTTAPVHLKSHGLPTRVKFSEGYEVYCFGISSFFPHFPVFL